MIECSFTNQVVVGSNPVVVTKPIFIFEAAIVEILTRKKNLYFEFVDSRKTFDQVPRDILFWALRKLRVEEWLVKTV